MNPNTPQHQINLDTHVQLKKKMCEALEQLVSTYIEQQINFIAAMMRNY